MRRLILLVAALGLVATGCGGGDDMSVDGQWARNSPTMADAGAAYMNIESAEADRLLSASVDSSVATMVEIHETVAVDSASGDDMEMSEGDDMSSEDGMGMMTMQPVDAIELPAGETVSLKPGGYHVMMMGLPQPLEIGQKFDITLSFENHDDVVVEVEVMEEAP